MRQWCMLAACAVALAGCQTDGGGTATAAGSPAGPPPANYRQLAAAHVKSSFKDPYTIRDAEIAPPKLAMGPSLNSDGFTTPWVVCMRANAKNSMGAYTGRKFTAIAISGDKVVNAWEAPEATGFLCADLAYQPFPEIEETKR